MKEYNMKRLYTNIHSHPKIYHGQIRKDELKNIFEYQTLFAKENNIVGASYFAKSYIL